MPGIIGSQIQNGNTTYGAATTPYDATLRTVDPDTETVSGQLDKILASGSPYLQRAQSLATDQANSRGLLNSTMATQAGTAAAIDAALPVAQQDASTFSNTSAQNQAYKNQQQAFNAGAENTSSLAQSQAANASQMATQQAKETAAITIPALTERDVKLQTLKGTQAENLTNIEGSYKSLLQTSASAATLYQDASRMMAAVMADTNTSDAQKQQAIDFLSAQLGTGLSLIAGLNDIDISQLLTFG